MSFDACKTILTSSQKRYVKPKQWNKKEIDLALKIMTVTKNGISFKHFHTWEQKSKLIVAQIYSQARSSYAEKFLEHWLKTAPYKVLSIQIDDGSEFVKDSTPLKNITRTVRIPPCTD